MDKEMPDQLELALKAVVDEIIFVSFLGELAADFSADAKEAAAAGSQAQRSSQMRDSTTFATGAMREGWSHSMLVPRCVAPRSRGW
jgi:hypothetical protein